MPRAEMERAEHDITEHSQPICRETLALRPTHLQGE